MYIAASEFVGGEIVVKASPNPVEQGLRGKVVDETMKTFIIDVDGEEKRVAKAGRVFLWEGKQLDGDAIVFRPEDRIKKAKK